MVVAPQPNLASSAAAGPADRLASLASSVVSNEIVSGRDARPGSDWRTIDVGVLAGTARRHCCYWNPVDWPLLITAAFLLGFTFDHGFLSPLRFESQWKFAYFSVTPCMWAYTMWYLWTRRPQPGDKFKAFVLQEGYVYSRLLETYTWVWISMAFAVFLTVCAWASLIFKFEGNPLPGSRNYMWVYPYFCNLPLVLGLDPVSSTTSFKHAAARRCYPGMAGAHRGYWTRFVLLCIHIVVTYFAWLLICTPGGLLYQYNYDMYFLYLELGGYTLVSFILLPRYASMLKSEGPRNQSFLDIVTQDGIVPMKSFWRSTRRASQNAHVAMDYHSNVREELSGCLEDAEAEWDLPGMLPSRSRLSHVSETCPNKADGSIHNFAETEEGVAGDKHSWIQASTAVQPEIASETRALVCHGESLPSLPRGPPDETFEDIRSTSPPIPGPIYLPSVRHWKPWSALSLGSRTAVIDLLGPRPVLRNNRTAFGDSASDTDCSQQLVPAAGRLRNARHTYTFPSAAFAATGSASSVPGRQNPLPTPSLGSLSAVMDLLGPRPVLHNDRAAFGSSASDEDSGQEVTAAASRLHKAQHAYTEQRAALLTSGSSASSVSGSRNPRRLLSYSGQRVAAAGGRIQRGQSTHPQHPIASQGSTSASPDPGSAQDVERHQPQPSQSPASLAAVLDLHGPRPVLHNDRTATGGSPSAEESDKVLAEAGGMPSWTSSPSTHHKIPVGRPAIILEQAASSRGMEVPTQTADVASTAERIKLLGFDSAPSCESSSSPGSAMAGGRNAVLDTADEFVSAVVALPQGIQLLVVNLIAALQQFTLHWDWWAATQPQKFLFTVGGLAAASILWIVEAVQYSPVRMVVNATAMAWVVLLVLLVLFGPLKNADLSMVLKVAENGGSIGSGLVYSTSSILNALKYGGPLAMGYAANEERLLKSAAVSCRWDYDAAWPLEVQERGWGRTRHCRVMFPCVQLYRAALAARQAGCRYMWIDTLSVPQTDENDPPEVAQLKAAVLRRLVPVMTAVYATARLVIVVETVCGQRTDENAYSCRTWTLQECMINRNTAVVHLDGRYTVLGDATSRKELSGLADDRLTKEMDNLGAYTWILPGEEREAAMRTTRRQRMAFTRFVDTRSAARSADKAVAIGQIFFGVLFEHVGVATTFMMEMVVLLAEHADDAIHHDESFDVATRSGSTYCLRYVTLIDNTGWDPATMAGSAARSRFLMGKPSFLEHGQQSLWSIRRVPTAAFPADDDMAQDEQPAQNWWLCEVQLEGYFVLLALLPGKISLTDDGRFAGHLHKLRTCTALEKNTVCTVRDAGKLEHIEVLWL